MCPRYLHPTIRITTKCTQKCSHCCYSCSPEESIFMSEEVSKNLGIFLRNNEIKVINLMGGEFFCHPSWEKVISNIALGDNLLRIRLVTNGDWATKKDSDRVITGLAPFKKIIKIAISEDSKHTNRWTQQAHKLCDENNFDWVLSSPEHDNSDAYIPVGRNRFNYGFFSLLARYCDKAKNKYSFLIDEVGDIFKCPFGVWRCGSIQNHLDSSFSKFFVKFNTLFYTSSFFMNCQQCLLSHDRNPQFIIEGMSL